MFSSKKAFSYSMILLLCLMDNTLSVTSNLLATVMYY